eukprot:CAMPEP_0197664348 /NCGR_PEP_ID=MMETSP1338-20131121/58579_1 /TAXON_ID=43686 ORGANISM="Pelagodinium beii, Strain RCC1491" /NCGR_SAMPLE_ID=MMETSP1338 /ASSEMBLY_ACC=CAM_ASM_000754 /LENGTH=358 /DNA_ID=CAMNT_0043242965 /DNA_START=23 /DNA_END=1099 /DNA_ORIENTATION=-
MPPKSRAKSQPKADSKKKSGKKTSPSPSPISDKKQLELNFLNEVTYEASVEDIQKSFKFLGYGMNQGDRHYLKAACAAVERVCEEHEGLLTLIKAKGIETMLSIVRHMPHAHVSPSMSEAINAAAAAVYRQSSNWLDYVDQVDFHELPTILHLAHWLGAEDEDVALSSLGAMERFCLYRSEHGATLLASDVLQVVHRIIGHNRTPELLTEAFNLLFRLCDLPGATVVPLVHRESGLVSTVVESLHQAPLNMRLQLAGLRLLALWSQLVIENDGTTTATATVSDLKELVRLAKAEDHAKEVVANLSRSGLTHAAGWISAIASRLPRPTTKTEPSATANRRSTANKANRRSTAKPSKQST